MKGRKGGLRPAWRRVCLVWDVPTHTEGHSECRPPLTLQHPACGVIVCIAGGETCTLTPSRVPPKPASTLAQAALTPLPSQTCPPPFAHPLAFFREICFSLLWHQSLYQLSCLLQKSARGQRHPAAGGKPAENLHGFNQENRGLGAQKGPRERSPSHGVSQPRNQDAVCIIPAMHTKPGVTCTAGGSDGVARDRVTTKEAMERPVRKGVCSGLSPLPPLLLVSIFLFSAFVLSWHLGPHLLGRGCPSQG